MTHVYSFYLLPCLRYNPQVMTTFHYQVTEAYTEVRSSIILKNAEMQRRRELLVFSVSLLLCVSALIFGQT